jgi:hypothetical protein
MRTMINIFNNISDQLSTTEMLKLIIRKIDELDLKTVSMEAVWLW